jgi:hypothetical protein
VEGGTRRIARLRQGDQHIMTNIDIDQILAEAEAPIVD